MGEAGMVSSYPHYGNATNALQNALRNDLHNALSSAGRGALQTSASWLSQQAQGAQLHGQFHPTGYDTRKILADRTNIVVHKCHARIDKLVEALPMKLAGRISEIRLEQSGNNYAFVVIFEGGHELTFENVDEFPTDADLARIALEAP